MYRNLLKDTKILKISNGIAAGTSNVITDTFAMDGYGSVCIFADLSAVTDAATVQLTACDGLLSNGTDGTVIRDVSNNVVQTTALVTSGNSNQAVALDVQRPGGPNGANYVTACLVRSGQNVTVTKIWAMLYNPVNTPVTQPASIACQATCLAAT
jgi:hypothetical protein